MVSQSVAEFREVAVAVTNFEEAQTASLGELNAGVFRLEVQALLSPH